MAITDAFVQFISGYQARATGGVSIAPTGVKKNSYFQPSWTFQTGAPNRIETFGMKAGTLAAAANVEVNLIDGTLLDLLGNPCVFTTITAVAVSLTSTTALSSLTIGGTPSGNGHKLWFRDIADAMDIEIGGPSFVQGSITPRVVDGTHKIFRVTNNGAVSSDYLIMVAGRTT